MAIQSNAIHSRRFILTSQMLRFFRKTAQDESGAGHADIAIVNLPAGTEAQVPHQDPALVNRNSFHRKHSEKSCLPLPATQHSLD